MHNQLILIKPISISQLNDKLFEINQNKKDLVEGNLVFNQLKFYLKTKNFDVMTIDKAEWEDATHIVFFDLAFYDKYLKKLKKLKRNRKLKAKISLVLFESELINPRQYLKKRQNIFDKVLTWKSDLIDNKKYFKYFLPQIILAKNIYNIPFTKKDFLCIINANKIAIGEGELYSERKKIILFFNKMKEGIDVYGFGWNQKQFKLSLINLIFRWKYLLKKSLSLDFNPFLFLIEYAFNIKKIKGLKYPIYSPLDILSKYKFAVCFENAKDIHGYITEKIFNCYNARCIPIYLGTKEINNYIPSNCYIDMRKFKNYELLYKYLKSIDENKYKEYIRNIDKFMNTNKSYVFSNENFIKTFYEVLIK